MNASEITSFVKSSEAVDLIAREPLPNLKRSLDEAILTTAGYRVLSGVLATVRMINY